MSSAGKLIMFAVLSALITVVSGECEEKCHCSKYKVFCSLARLRALPTRIPNTTELVKIELDNIPRIGTSPGLENVIHLQLVKVNLTEIEAGAFQNMSRLQYLVITHNNIHQLETDSFKYLNDLYLLNLSRNEIELLSPGTFSGLQNLRILDLSDNYIYNLQANVFGAMRCNEINNLEYENLFGRSVIEPAAFKYLTALTYFDLTHHNPNSIPKHVSFGLRISMFYSYIEYVKRGNKLVISELLYLDLSHIIFGNLKEKQFQNFAKLIYLDLSYNSISEIKCGDFEGLVSLKTLKLNYNGIYHLNNATFNGLQSLEFLDISHCVVRVIDSRAFEGLSKLRTLDLSRNDFDSLNNSTFSTLGMLKELRLDGNTITHIDSECFGDFSNLKSLLNNAFEKHLLTDTSDIEHLKWLNTLSEKSFVQFQRLDNLQLFLRITIPKEIQVLNALHLYIHAGYDVPRKELRRVLQTVRYVRSLSVTLLHVTSTHFLAKFYEFYISDLTMSFSNSVFLNSKVLCCLPRLKSLTVYGMLNSKIKDGAFRGMKQLKELRLHYTSKFKIKYGLFLGLDNLKFLSIYYQNYHDYFRKRLNETQETIKYIDKGVFFGLDNLTELDLRRNYLTHLKPGAFHGLNKIEKIDLSDNSIARIEASVFGAICKDAFEMSCKNVTSPEYCNNSNALKTLKYLYLRNNLLSHIHPHAFISCTNLQILDLTWNRFLTLDIPFLYTPALRRLDMSECSITTIPNETFACTPLLSQIDFRYNNMSKLTVSALLPLRHLQNIYLRQSNLSCDCHLHETWMWLRQHRVNYELSCNDTEIDTVLSDIKCNNTRIIIYSPHNRTTDTNDFAFFKHYIEQILLIIILTFGLVSNGFLLFVALRHPDMRTKQNACVIHLAAVELLSLVLNLPLSYWDVVNIRWEFDDTLCKIFIFSKDVGVAVTAFSTVALSAERFLVARTFQNLKKMCKSKTQPTAWLLLMTWISGIVCSLPAYSSAGVFEGRCLYCPPGNQSYIRNVWTFQLVMYCLLPASAITFLNVKTSLFLRASIRNIPGEIKDNERVKNRRKVANVALILVLVFIVSYLPNYILRLLVAWSLVDMEDLFLPSFFTFCLFFCNAAFNPISIFIMSSKFKSYAFRYFPFLENPQHSRPVPRILDGNVRRHKKSGE